MQSDPVSKMRCVFLVRSDEGKGKGRRPFSLLLGINLPPFAVSETTIVLTCSTYTVTWYPLSQ